MAMCFGGAVSATESGPLVCCLIVSVRDGLPATRRRTLGVLLVVAKVSTDGIDGMMKSV